MPVNRYDQIADFSWSPMPFNEIMGVGELMQKQEDKAKASLHEIGNAKWSALPNDEERAHQLKQEINKSVLDFHNKYTNRGYREGTSDLANLQYTTNAKLEEARAHEQRTKDYYTMVEDVRKNSKLNEYQKQDYLDQLHEQAYNPQLAANYNYQTGSVNHIQPPREYEHKDINKWGEDALKTIEADKIAGDSGYANYDEFYRDNTHSERKFRTADKIANTLAELASRDEGLKKSAEVETKYGDNLYGISPQQEHHFIGGRVKQDNPQTHQRAGDYIIDPTTRIGSTIGALAYGGSYSQTEHSVQEHNDDVAQERAKKKIADLPEVVAKEVQAPTYGTTVDSQAKLNESKEANRKALVDEFNKITAITPSIKSKYKFATSTGFINDILDMEPSKRDLVVNDILKNTQSDRIGIIKSLIQDQEDIRQRDKEATEYARSQDTNVETLKNYKEAKSLIKGLDVTKDSDWEIAKKNLGLEKTGQNKLDDIANTILRAKTYDIQRGYNGREDLNFKEEYLKKTAEKHIPLSMADSHIIPSTIVKDQNGNYQVIEDEKKGDNITNTIAKNYKAGAFDNLPTNIVNPDKSSKDGKIATYYTVGEIMDQKAERTAGGQKTKMPDRTPIFYTRLPGEAGVIQLVTSIGDQEVKINSNQIQVSLDGKMTPLSDISDSPEKRINARILRAYNNGLQEIPTSDGISVKVPYDIDDKAIANGTYANSSQLIVTTSKEDQKKRGMPENYVGAAAYQYLKNKQVQGIINF